MPKTKKIAVKETKQKLSPEERSQIAKDRWAKRRGEEDSKNVVMGGDVSTSSTEPTSVIIPIPPPEQPPVAPESIAPGMSGTPENLIPFRPAPSLYAVEYIPDAATLEYIEAIVEERMAKVRKEMEEKLSVTTLTPLLPPVVTQKKQKKAPVPKEFSVALKAAESRLAKAIQEHAEALGKYNSLQAEIPYLLDIIKSLKGEHPSPVPQSFVAPQFQALMPQFQTQPYVDPLAAIQASMSAPPVSRASGGAVQFAPEMLGTLEGPDDDDPDRFISGPNAGGGWIGG